MQPCHRVVWSEGLMLAPHHFQQWEAFHDTQAVERQAMTTAYPWGVHSMEIDTESLARGDFRLLSFRGVLPSGVLVRVPELDPPPPVESFRDSFGHRADAIDVFLGLPFRRTGWPNYVRAGEATAGARDARYAINTVIVADESTGRDDRTIERAEQNLRVLFGTTGRENYEAVAIARVTRTPTGDFKLVDGYVPPSLAIQASPFLRRLARSILERLVARSTELATRFAEGGIDARDITPANLRSFLHFAVVNGAIPGLAHMQERESTHPEMLYHMLASLAGHLTTFNASRFHPRDVPPYRHDNLGEVFAQIEKMIVDLLEIGGGHPGYDVLRLIPAGPEGQWQVPIEKESLLGASAAVILSVSSERLTEVDVRSAVGRLIISSADRLPQKLATNVPGVMLHSMAVPPPAIPRRSGALYFQLDNRGQEWEAIRASRGFSLYVPAELREAAQVELLAIEGRR